MISQLCRPPQEGSSRPPPDASVLSFDVAGLLLIWALKPCDRASTALSGEFAKGTLVTVDSGWKSSSLGGDGRLVLGSPAPP